jgi:signal peptidase I
MFETRKLNRRRRDVAEWLAGARVALAQQPPDPIEAAAREALEQRLQRLEALLPTAQLDELEAEFGECRRLVDGPQPTRRLAIVREYVELIAVALALALFVRAFVVQAFKIPSGSMIPTLLVGDHILVNKFIYGIAVPFTDRKIPLSKPRRGDIVVFKFPDDTTKDYIKRVIGLPGDTIQVRNTDLIVNGKLLGKVADGEFRFEDPKGYDHLSELFDETIDGRRHLVLYDKTTTRMDSTRTVPPGQYFCMGDNRDHSNDSRSWGFVPARYLKGQAMIVYFSWPPGQLRRVGRILH